MALSFSLLDTPASPIFNLNFEIVSAQGIEHTNYLNLAAGVKGHISSSDAYTKIEINGKPMAYSHPVFEVKDPQWDEKFYFDNVPNNSTIKLIVLGTDMSDGDEFGEALFDIGKAKFDLNEVISLPIMQGDSDAGTINIKVSREDSKDDANAPLKEVGPVRFSKHSSYTAGTLKKLTSDDEDWKSLAYIVQLHNVPLFMPNDNEWNKNYDKIQRVFSPDHIEAPLLSGLVQTQHAVVYKHSQKSTVYGYINKADDFFNAINNGMRREKPVIFTYAITSKGWLFSETGADFFKDMLSKHMLHANTAESVKYAGEFRIEVMNNGSKVLVLDNNSGTYAPSVEGLPQLKRLMEDNFPDIFCDVLDRNDERAVARRKEILALWED